MLLQKLLERQRTLDWTDEAMAARLGVPRTTFSAVKNRHTGISLRMARKIVAAFPDLEPFIWADETKTGRGEKKPVSAA